MRLAGMAAADEGVHALDAVDQPVLDQEIERAVDGRRRRAEVLVAQLVEQRVGADRLVARPHQLEHAPAQRREAQVLPGAQLFGRRDRILDAVIVIVAVAAGRLWPASSRDSRFAKQLPGDYTPRSSVEAKPCPPQHPSPIRRPRSTSCIAAIQFDAQGLVPAIAQQHDTGEVLMMAWMDRDAVAETMRTGRACYWSRSRKAPWRKGDTSGHIQTVVDLRVDCDGDTLLVAGRPDRRRLPYRTAQLLLPRHPRRRARDHRAGDDRHGQDREGQGLTHSVLARRVFLSPLSPCPAGACTTSGLFGQSTPALHAVAARRPAGALDPEQPARSNMMAPEAPALMGITNEGRDIPVRQLAQEDGNEPLRREPDQHPQDPRPDLPSPPGRRAHLLHHSDTQVHAAGERALSAQRQAFADHRHRLRRKRFPAADRFLVQGDARSVVL